MRNIDRPTPALSWLSRRLGIMVLGAILSLNHQLLNATNHNTSVLALNLASNFTRMGSSVNATMNDMGMDDNKEVIPAVELILGTITYLVSSLLLKC